MFRTLEQVRILLAADLLKNVAYWTKFDTKTDLSNELSMHGEYLDPSDADTTLKQLLNGGGEEEGHSESHRGVQ